jgi:hypothetical protein
MEKKKILVVIGVVLLAILLLTIFKPIGSKISDTVNTGDGSSVEKIYSIESESGLSGRVQAEQWDDGRVTIDFVLILEDDSIQNNGTCVDLEGTWCENEEYHRTEEIKYQYMPQFISSSPSDDVHAGFLQPVYCNKEEIKSTFDKTIDKFCGYTTATWVPTSTFIITGLTTYDSVEEFEGVNKIQLHDTSSMHRISYVYDEITMSSTWSEENLTYAESTKGEVVKTYDIKFTEL